MSIEFVKGDLFASSLPAVAHGCNCAGAMGKGIAVMFKKKFPRMFEEYKIRCKEGLFLPGDVFTWQEDGLTVFNLGTQKSWRSKATIPAVKAAVEKMLTEAEKEGLDIIGLPRIGAGLGQLEWESVKDILTEASQDTPIRLMVFEEFVSGVPAQPQCV